MADRTVYGNQFSENGWRMVDQGSCQWVKVPGTNVSLQIREGQPVKILGAFVADWNAYIEPVRDRDSACWTATNSVASSNHLSGTACDVCWDSHPFRVADAGFNATQLKTMREMLAFYEDMVFWGNDWSNPKDAMHVQMGYETAGPANFAKVENFIGRKIRADGFSTFRRDSAPPLPPPPPPAAEGLTAQRLSQAMGSSVPLDRYRQLLPGMRAAMVQAGVAGNLNRTAMWLAQLGHESGGLKWMEEIASGSAYEGRADLGNTQPGDGVRFKGHGPIQITGRHNHAKVSEWAFSKGYVNTPTFFVDYPQALASDEFGFLGPVWYWTVARPNINSMCDAGDLVGVTRAINGGTNGLDDRRARWNRCLGMGLAALNVSGDTPPVQGEEDDMFTDEDRAALRFVREELSKKFTSRSRLRSLGQGPLDTVAGFVLNLDGNQHVEFVRVLASLGHPGTLALLDSIANGNPAQYPDRVDDIQLAQAILADVEAKKNAPVQTLAESYNAPAPEPQVVYVDRPVPAPFVPEVSSGETSNSTGQLIGSAYDALQALRLADALPIEDRAPLAALISVLQTKNGSSI